MRLTDRQRFLAMAELIGEMAKKVRVQCPRCGALLDQKGFCSKCARRDAIRG